MLALLGLAAFAALPSFAKSQPIAQVAQGQFVYDAAGTACHVISAQDMQKFTTDNHFVCDPDKTNRTAQGAPFLECHCANGDPSCSMEIFTTMAACDQESRYYFCLSEGGHPSITTETYKQMNLPPAALKIILEQNRNSAPCN